MRDLGVQLNSDLNYKSHVEQNVAGASKLAWVFQDKNQMCHENNLEVFDPAQNGLMPSTLDFECLLESVQHHFTS